MFWFQYCDSNSFDSNNCLILMFDFNDFDSNIWFDSKAFAF